MLNRIKPLLGELIFENQSDFVGHRQYTHQVWYGSNQQDI